MLQNYKLILQSGRFKRRIDLRSPDKAPFVLNDLIRLDIEAGDAFPWTLIRYATKPAMWGVAYSHSRR